MPEYAFAIDLYGDQPRHVYVQEYAPPKTVDQESARERRREAFAVLPDVLGVPMSQVHSRTRAPKKGDAQYEKQAASGERSVIEEGGLKFWVNFRDYLDTGLFLDHRIIRQRLREWAEGTDFLNLFCYTGSATVFAAAGGARSSVSVDLSNTYLDWAHANLALNGFDQPAQDVQRDHAPMIRNCLSLLRARGRLVFSTNYSRFELDAAALSDVAIEDVSAEIVPYDFARHARIHRCYVIRK
jgi:23S rRNA (guanine2445-N2)-methyltransferase / 23S rRNA (guanine2069-N7)-methyltransferase